MAWKPARGCPVEQLPDLPPDDKYALEWKTYKREVVRLVAEGNEGKFVLIRGDAIIGIWDRREDAMAVGYERFGYTAIYVHEINAIEPIYRSGYMRQVKTQKLSPATGKENLGPNGRNVMSMSDPALSPQPFDMPAPPPDHPLAKAWAVYAREVDRLLGEGNEGRYALVGDDAILGVFASSSEASTAGYVQLGLNRPFMVHQIRACEPVYRVRG